MVERKSEIEMLQLSVNLVSDNISIHTCIYLSTERGIIFIQPFVSFYIIGRKIKHENQFGDVFVYLL